jgi:hypothetical protein
MGAGKDQFMKPREFAGLTFDEQSAVWNAHRRGLVQAVPASPAGPVLRYHRGQVRKLLRKAAVSRG